MSQVWSLPILGTDLLSDSYSEINDAFDSLRSHWIGSADPSSPAPVEGQISINTTSGKVKGKRLADTVNLGDWAAEMGHVRQDGTTPLTANWNVGSFKLTSLAAPTADQDAATKKYVDDSISQPLTFLSSPVTLITILNSTGSSYSTIDISTHISPDNASIAILQIESDYMGADVGSTLAAFSVILDLRATGEAGPQAKFKHSGHVDLDNTGGVTWDSAGFGMSSQRYVPLDANNQFDIRHNSLSFVTNGTYSVVVKLIGYFKSS